MQTAVSVKTGAAFLAGVALALGSAYTYFKMADPHASASGQPIVKVARNTTPPAAAPDPTPLVKLPEPTAPVAETPTPVKVPSAPKVIHPKLVLPRPNVASRPVSLAVAYPATQYQPTPAPVQAAPIPQDIAAVPASAPAVAAPVQAAPPQPHTVTIPEGTSLAVRVNEKLSTEHNYSGDTFRATLESPVVVDGFIIADRGAKVLGQIVKAQKPGKMQGTAELTLTLTEIATTDGQHLHVETNQSLRKGPSSTNEDVMKMGGGAALGAIIGAIAGGGKGAAIGAGAGGAAGTGAVLLGHSKPAVIENETRLTFQLAVPTIVTEHIN